LPTTSSDGEFIFREIEGELLDPDAILAKYTDWHNSAEWPVIQTPDHCCAARGEEQADPLTKPGLVGDILPHLHR
jgi:hypothetical protein